MVTKVVCPYCGKQLNDKPSRKKKCPFCTKNIFVRNGELLTEENANIKDWITRLDPIGLNEKVFNTHRDALKKQFGSEPSVSDTIWRFFNFQISVSESFSSRKQIYQEMARLVLIEGKDPKPYLSEATKQELLEYKSYGIVKVKVVNTTDSLVCLNCQKLNGAISTVEMALEKMLIPHVCENPDGCRCYYSVVWE